VPAKPNQVFAANSFSMIIKGFANDFDAQVDSNYASLPLQTNGKLDVFLLAEQSGVIKLDRY